MRPAHGTRNAFELVCANEDLLLNILEATGALDALNLTERLTHRSIKRAANVTIPQCERWVAEFVTQFMAAGPTAPTRSAQWRCNPTKPRYVSRARACVWVYARERERSESEVLLGRRRQQAPALQQPVDLARGALQVRYVLRAQQRHGAVGSQRHLHHALGCGRVGQRLERRRVQPQTRAGLSVPGRQLLVERERTRHDVRGPQPHKTNHTVARPRWYGTPSVYSSP